MDLMIIILIMMHIQLGYQDILKKSQRKCRKLLKEPNFSEDLVAGHTWRIFYSWNKMTQMCVEVQFSKPTAKSKRHYRTHMSEYVKDGRDWSQAKLLAKSGKSELLMFPEETAGEFQCIPNVDIIDDFPKDNFAPMKFALKLVGENKFLIMVDCKEGLGQIMAKAGDTVTKEEVLEVADDLGFGEGYIGCV